MPPASSVVVCANIYTAFGLMRWTNSYAYGNLKMTLESASSFIKKKFRLAFVNFICILTPGSYICHYVIFPKIRHLCSVPSRDEAFVASVYYALGSQGSMSPVTGTCLCA